MSCPPENDAEEPRERASRTKRARSRAALLNAARTTFEANGWAGTRMEDVAVAARVSVATTYNHFGSKHILLANVYAPLLRVALETSRSFRESAQPTAASALERHVRDLTQMIFEHRALTVALTHAMHEHGERVGRAPRPDDADDPRALVPFADELVRIVKQGQREGRFQEFPPAQQVATLASNLLLAHPVVQPDQSPESAAEVMLTVLFGLLQPETLVEAGRAGRPFAAKAEGFEHHAGADAG